MRHSGGDVGAGEVVVTWHHGVMAQWWANFHLDGPEIEFFRPYVEAGQPALDLGCGSGRLLVPWVSSGLDVDGVDVSEDMIAACHEAARRAGCDPNLYVQATHELDVPRRYGAIVMCGVLGLGVTREQDLEGLRRARHHLEAGGVLVLDSEVADFDAIRSAWSQAVRDASPPPAHARELAPDGFEYAQRHRIISLESDTRQVTREVDAWQWRDGELIAHETRPLLETIYTSDEIVSMLTAAGFAEVTVRGGYHGGPPTGGEAFLVYVARAD